MLSVTRPSTVETCIKGAKLYQRLWCSSVQPYVTCADCSHLRLRSDGRGSDKKLLARSHMIRYSLFAQQYRLWGSSKYPLHDQHEENTAQQPDVKLKKGKIDTIVKVQATIRTKKKRQMIDLNKAFHENVFTTPVRAMEDFLLDKEDIDSIQTTKRRSPYPEVADMTVVLRKDVEAKAIEKYGSLENMYAAKKKLVAAKERWKPFRQFASPWSQQKRSPLSSSESKTVEQESIFSHGPGRVVMTAIVVNGVNCVLKFGGWHYTGSHSMFSEFLHSLADTANQIILAFGIHKSLKKADLEHPYGWSNFRNVASLISGVGILSIGAGLSFYHGIHGLLHPTRIDSLYWAVAMLGGSFVSEGGTLLVAIQQITKASKEKNMKFFDYVWRGEDPSTNVVLLEDLAAVLGVTIACTCMSLSYFWQTTVPDAVGSLLISGLLGITASVIIYTNTSSLVGRSIHPEKKQNMMKMLESDRVVRALHDVKATDMGGSYIRFKAEVDFDGREITLFYLQRQDLDIMLKEVQGFETVEELEMFLLRHGEKIVDEVGGQVDRIETALMKRYPEIRHVDLEQL